MGIKITTYSAASASSRQNIFLSVWFPALSRCGCPNHLPSSSASNCRIQGKGIGALHFFLPAILLGLRHGLNGVPILVQKGKFKKHKSETRKWWFLKPLWQAGRFEDKWGGFVRRYAGRWIPDGKEMEGCWRQLSGSDLIKFHP